MNQAKRLLLIDDNVADLRVLTEIATRNGISVAVACNGKDGLNKARMSTFDLILLDVRMPVLDGFGTCRLLKADKRTQHIPVIFLSTAGDQDSRLAGFKLGAVDYIVKEYANEEEIAARINVHLQNVRQRNDIEEGAQESRITPLIALLEAAKTLFRQELPKNLPVGEIAQLLGVSENRLNDSFRRIHGLSAHGWMRDEKLRIGCEMLAETDASINAIAHHLGYSSAQNFATAFRERFHLTPKEYRAETLNISPPEHEETSSD